MASLLGDDILPSSEETLDLLLHEFERGPYQVHCKLLTGVQRCPQTQIVPGREYPE